MCHPYLLSAMFSKMVAERIFLEKEVVFLQSKNIIIFSYFPTATSLGVFCFISEVQYDHSTSTNICSTSVKAYFI